MASGSENSWIQMQKVINFPNTRHASRFKIENLLAHARRYPECREILFVMAKVVQVNNKAVTINDGTGELKLLLRQTITERTQYYINQHASIALQNIVYTRGPRGSLVGFVDQRNLYLITCDKQYVHQSFVKYDRASGGRVFEEDNGMQTVHWKRLDLHNYEDVSCNTLRIYES